MGIVSMVFLQSGLLQKDVYLTDLITQTKRDRMTHMKAVVFIRPVRDSIEALVAELHDPKYSEYHVVFCNKIEDSELRTLAEGDEHEVVQSVFEMFTDFYAVNRLLFTMNIPNAAILHCAVDQPPFYRQVDGLFSVLLALKKKPVIRFSGGSKVTKELALELNVRSFAIFCFLPSFSCCSISI